MAKSAQANKSRSMLPRFLSRAAVLFFAGAVRSADYYCRATLYHGYLCNLMHSAERVEYDINNDLIS
jgi:hypothetical protein